MPGYPIRTPWDHSSVDSSPRPIAASHVLHRLLVPRHPPFALDNLTTKMLASTVQFSTNNQPTTHHPTPATPPPPTGQHPVCEARPCLATEPTPQRRQQFQRNNPQQGLFLQDPTGCYPPSPAAPDPPFHTNPERSAVQEEPSRCQKKTHQCLRHSSTPTRHPQVRGSIPAFAGWCSLERR